MIKIEDLNKYYGNEIILENINLQFGDRGLYCIVGPSGCGKSTLLNLIGNIDQSYEGVIKFNDENIKYMKDYYRNNVSFVFQTHHLISWLNFNNNLKVSNNLHRGLINSRFIHYVEKFSLTDSLPKKIKKLSGGQKQRGSIIRAINNNTSVILCDEPTSSLDPVNAEIVFQDLKMLAKEKLVIVVSHDEVLTTKYADYLIKYQNNNFRVTKQKVKQYVEEFNLINEQTQKGSLVKLPFNSFIYSFSRNFRTITTLALNFLVIILIFTLSFQLQEKIYDELENILPSSTISCIENNNLGISYANYQKLKESSSSYSYFELKDYQFLGISLNNEYKYDDTVFISDMSKEINEDMLGYGSIHNQNQEVVLSLSTANKLSTNINDLVGKKIWGYFLINDETKKVELKVTGITANKTILDSMYISEDANINWLKSLINFDLEDLKGTVAIISLPKNIDSNELLKDWQERFPNFKFQISNRYVKQQLDMIIKTLNIILIIFSVLCVVSSCFLIGEVIYLNVVSKKRDYAVLKCFGSSRIQLVALTLIEVFMFITISYLFAFSSYASLCIVINDQINNYLTLSTPLKIDLNSNILIITYISGLSLGIVSSLASIRYITKIPIISAFR